MIPDETTLKNHPSLKGKVYMVAFSRKDYDHGFAVSLGDIVGTQVDKAIIKKILDEYEESHFQEEYGEHSLTPMHRSDWLALREELLSPRAQEDTEMVEDWEIEKISECTTGAEVLFPKCSCPEGLRFNHCAVHGDCWCDRRDKGGAE